MKRLIVALALSVAMLYGGWAQASITAFGDTATLWPGWTSISSSSTGGWSNSVINGTEHIGVPDLFGGTAGTVAIDDDSSQLLSIALNYDSNLEPQSVNRSLKYGDLFLDVNADGSWDYVVRSDVLGTGSYTDAQVTDAKSLSVRYFAAGIPEAPPSPESARVPNMASYGPYMLSNSSTQRNGGSWSGYVIRYDHPWALTDEAWNAGTDAGTAYFDGWQDNNADGWSTYDFANASIALPFDDEGAHNVTIGFTCQCANDVLYETIRTEPLNLHEEDLVPEPASIIVWLLIVGASWLAVRVRRRAA